VCTAPWFIPCPEAEGIILRAEIYVPRFITKHLSCLFLYRALVHEDSGTCPSIVFLIYVTEMILCR
jgi:hypothetical protein